MSVQNEQDNDFFNKVDFGVKRGVARALAEHKKAGKSIVISQNGKIVEIPPEKIEIPDEFKNILQE
jgi:hypothetical protein